MTLSEIMGVASPLLIAIIAWYYKKDAESNQSIIKTLVTEVGDIKKLLTEQARDYKYLSADMQEQTKEHNILREKVYELEKKVLILEFGKAL